MAEIGAIAARGDKMPPELLDRVGIVAQRMPLTPEPFLIHGAVAQMAGRGQAAELLFVEARSRNPRSPGARYFLAERYLGTDRVEQALVEMAVLSRLTNAARVFGPGLAAYAPRPGAVPQLRRFFRRAPEFEPVVLSSLAADAKNLGLISALWSRSRADGAVHLGWQTLIVAKLLEGGDYQRARAAWRQFAGVSVPASSVFNPEFRKVAAPPPFNWKFGSDGGLAQPTGVGRLEVIYFGRDDAVLAEQLMTLGPGRYVLSMRVDGDIKPGSGVAWSIDCMPQKQTLVRLDVAKPKSGSLQAAFSVPQGCTAQQLQLSGRPGEFSKPVEFTIGRFQVARAS